MKVYIVLHHEFMGALDDYRVDEMVFFTASSIKKAVALIKRSSVDPWSWWEIQVQDLDDHEWPEHVGYYGRRGGKIAKPPYEKCLQLFTKDRRRRPRQ
jgi:hypothetical protein